MSLPSLFLKETSEGDISQTKLPQDMDLWAETITTKIRERLPMARHMLIKISFLNRNEELGIATGAATLHDQKLNKAVFIPLIVKNFSLSPMDIMMVPKKDTESGFEVTPFHKDIFAQVMFNSEVFDHLERPIDRIQQMYLNPQNTVVYPPNYRNVYASAGSQIIDSISGTISLEDKEAFLSDLKADPNTLVGYEKRANLGVLQKIATSEVRVTPESVARLKNISLLKKKDTNVQVFSTSDEVFDPIIEEGKEGLVACDGHGGKPIKEETLNEVRRNGEKMIFTDLNPKNDVMLGPLNSPEHYTKTDETPRDTKLFGAYKVQDKNGVFHKGIVIPNVIDFNMKVVGGKIFKSLNKSSFQDKIVGLPTGAEKLQFLKFREPSIGMTGTFVTYNETNALATIPVTIRSMADIGGAEHIVAIGVNGQKIKIKYGGYVESKYKEDDFGEDTLKNIAKVKDYYIVPSRFKFLALDNFCELMESGEKMSLKLASMNMDASPVRVIYTGDSQFALKGPDMTKMAQMCGWDATNLEASQAVFILSAKKCPLSKVAEALKTAGSHTREVAIHGLPKTNYEYAYNENETKLASAALEQISLLKTNLIKEAAGLEDSQIVDAALSLNFINPGNIDKFVSFVPVFEQCSKLLAQVLLASRLGIEEIPEQASATAMHKILEVIQGLKKLKSLEEKTAAKYGKGILKTVSKYVKKYPGEVAIGSGIAGMSVGSALVGRTKYKKGFNDGAQAMNNYMNTRVSNSHMQKAAGFFTDMLEGSDKVTYKNKKGKKVTTSAKDLATRAYKAAHGKNYGDK